MDPVKPNDVGDAFLADGESLNQRAFINLSTRLISAW
jgi:hypothetical protein